MNFKIAVSKNKEETIFQKIVSRALTLYLNTGFIILLSAKIVGINQGFGSKRRKNKMALRQGEVYRCPDANCGCEITVTKGAPETCKGQEQPRCCCGNTMEKASD